MCDQPLISRRSRISRASAPQATISTRPVPRASSLACVRIVSSGRLVIAGHVAQAPTHQEPQGDQGRQNLEKAELCHGPDRQAGGCDHGEYHRDEGGHWHFDLLVLKIWVSSSHKKRPRRETRPKKADWRKISPLRV